MLGDTPKSMSAPDQVTLSLVDFRELARSANLIPVSIDLVADSETPISIFAKIQEAGPCFLFESAETNEQSGRYSFIGFDPLLRFQSKGRRISLRRDGQTKNFETESDPLAELQTALSEYHLPPSSDLSHFAAGAVGYIGFESIQFFEPTVTVHAQDDLQLPDMLFVLARTMIVFDHRFRKLRLIVHALIGPNDDAEQAYANARAGLEELTARLSGPVQLDNVPAGRIDTLPQPRSNFERAEYEAIVRRARDYIAAGDIFQVVLSQRFETDFSRDALALYRCLRFGNPSPYMFLLKLTDDFTVLGSSPEMHLRVRGRTAEIRPIAGTHRRGKTPEEDVQLEKELLADPKERAEHVMLIDLGRNDLGRVAACGSVKVTEQMVIERYSHVMHIVSHVVSEMADGRNGFDALRATFPAGTVSGAPKIRAMQIIAELEKSRRGFYSGVAGYFGLDGSVDTCIALRSIVLKDGKAYLQTGAGIVADSDPGREFDECVNKAKAMLEAIQRAKQMKS